MTQNDPGTTAATMADEWTPERIKALKGRLGLTYRELAERCGVSTIAVQKWSLPQTSANHKSPNKSSCDALARLESQVTTAAHRGDEWTPERIKALRAHLGITQEELARECGVSMTAVQRWTFPKCSENRNIPSKPVQLILEQLEVRARHHNPMGIALIDPGQTGKKRGLSQGG